MIRACGWLVLLFLTAPVRAQAPAEPDGAQQAWTALRQRWAERDPPIDIATQLADLRAFTEKYTTGEAVALAHCHTGALLLRELDGAGAEAAFAHALRLAGDGQLDILGRGLYGLAQAQELQGRRADAKASLERIGPSLEGTRYHRYAQVALRRLATPRSLAEPGERMPPLQLGADVRTSAGPPALDEPWLLVFFHADHPTTIETVDRLEDVWDPGQRPMIAIDLSGRRDRCAELATKRGWACHTVCADGGFLHHDALQLGVATVPTWFVVDDKGKLLARDLSAERLRRLLR